MSVELYHQPADSSSRRRAGTTGASRQNLNLPKYSTRSKLLKPAGCLILRKLGQYEGQQITDVNAGSDATYIFTHLTPGTVSELQGHTATSHQGARRSVFCGYWLLSLSSLGPEGVRRMFWAVTSSGTKWYCGTGRRCTVSLRTSVGVS